MLSMKDLNLSEQEGLQEILDKHESAWNDEEIKHLNARRDYLSSDDLARLEVAEAAQASAQDESESETSSAVSASASETGEREVQPEGESQRAPRRATRQAR